VIVCKVIGNAVSTIKDKRLIGQTMLVVGRIGTDPGVVLDQFVALDAVGAGEGEIVGVIEGTPAQRVIGKEEIPIDAVIVAIFDSLMVKGKEIYKK
jgi:microcompartment protein CcmK/EutM